MGAPSMMPPPVPELPPVAPHPVAPEPPPVAPEPPPVAEPPPPPPSTGALHASTRQARRARFRMRGIYHAFAARSVFPVRALPVRKKLSSRKGWRNLRTSTRYPQRASSL